MGYLHNVVEELKSGLQRTNPESSRVEDLNQGPPDFKYSTLNHSAILPPLEPLSNDPFTPNPLSLSLSLSTYSTWEGVLNIMACLGPILHLKGVLFHASGM